MSAILDQSRFFPLGSAQVDIQLRVSAQVNITPFVARQKINVLMLDQVGNLLHGGEPELLVSEVVNLLSVRSQRRQGNS